MTNFRSLTSYSRRDIVTMAVIFCAYLAAASIGRFLFVPPAVIQPAAGVALAGLVIGGIALWPAIVAASIMNALFAGVPLTIVISSTLAHTLHAVIGAYMLKAVKFDPVFRRVRDMFAFMLIAVFASMIVPTIGLGGIYLNNFLFTTQWPVRTQWLQFWVGMMIGDLILAAALIRSFAKPYFKRTRGEAAELSLAFLALSVTTYFVFWTEASKMTNGLVLLVWLMPFIWFSLRLGIRFMFISFLMSTAIALTGVLYGGVPSEQSISYRIVVAELFMAALAVIFYLFAAVVEERKRASRQLLSQLERVSTLLEESKEQDRAKSEFISVFAHELRNPLAPIVSALDLLKLKGTSHVDASRIVGVIDDRVHTIVKLLDDLLDVSRISQNSVRLKMEEIDLTNCVRYSSSALRDLIEDSGITLSVAISHAPLPMRADPTRIDQVITNLLMNATKYTDSGGRIELSVFPNGGMAEIRVRDNGIGISSDMLQKIFEPFSGLGEGRQKQHIMKTGVGIGLWLTQRLVELHGGTIIARSAGAGKGSEFIVTLPLQSEIRTVKPLPITSRSMHESNEPMRILVVDDNEAAAKGLGTLLQHVGNKVDFAYVGADVAPKVDEFNPDVVVLDIGLPDMSGYDVAELLRKEGYKGRIIALTGYGQDEDKKKAEIAGFDFHLTKPVGIADLQAVLLKPQST